MCEPLFVSPLFFIVKDLDLSSPMDVGQVRAKPLKFLSILVDFIFYSYFSIYFGASVSTNWYQSLGYIKLGFIRLGICLIYHTQMQLVV